AGRPARAAQPPGAPAGAHRRDGLRPGRRLARAGRAGRHRAQAPRDPQPPRRAALRRGPREALRPRGSRLATRAAKPATARDPGAGRPLAAPAKRDERDLHRARNERAAGREAPVRRAETGRDARLVRTGDRDSPRVEPALPVPGHALRPPVRRGDGSVAVPDAARALARRRQVGKPLVVSAELSLGKGREAGPAGAWEPTRYALDG